MRVLGDFLTQRARARLMAAGNDHLLSDSMAQEFCELKKAAARLPHSHEKKNTLALVVGCGRLAAFAAPLL